jgi:hypothetical protein
MKRLRYDLQQLVNNQDMVAREGLEPPPPAFSGVTETLLAVTYKDVEGCETAVRTRKDKG